MSEKKLFLLDAFALIFRAYYALIKSPRITSKGRNTSAQFGFTTTLLDLINKEKPTHLAVVFDTSAPTERHIEFEAYKANRQETPEDLSAAVPDIKKIIRGFNLPCLELDGFEADDIIGTLAHEAGALGYKVYMVTPDKDYGQLVNENVFMYKPPAYGNKEEILGVAEVCEKWGIRNVDQVRDILGIMGDSVDNIPGIPGIGEKGAAKLLAEYDTIENMLVHADEIKGAIGEKVRKNKDLAVLSKKLATIITNVPISFHDEDFRIKEKNTEALREIFDDLEFKTLGKRVFSETGTAAVPKSENLSGLFAVVSETKETTVQKNTLFDDLEPVVQLELVSERTNLANITTTPHKYNLVMTDDEIQDLVNLLQTQTQICFDTESTNIDANLAEIVGMSFSWEKGVGYYVYLPPDRTQTNAILSKFQPLFTNPNILWVGQNIKYDMLLLKWYGFELSGSIYDTMLAHYVIEPDGKRSMDMLSMKYLSYAPVSIETLIGKKGKTQGTMRDAPLEAVKEYAAEDADITMQLKAVFDPILTELKVENVFYAAETPLVPVLTDMEFEGVGLDVEFLRDYSKELEKDIRLAEENIYNHAGLKFNIGSPKQLGDVLFEVMKIDPGTKIAKTKTGQYATGEDVLQKLRHRHGIIEDILAYRELTKLKSTYVDALPDLINPKTKRLHTSFAQAVAVTGRLSSNNPNLQNIPIRTDRGKEIRKAFIRRNEDYCILSADYSQIELRIVAGISGDEAMVQAFKDNKDIHTATAARVYGIAENEVTSAQRRNAKAVNFGIIYGQSAFGLAENLGISRSEAKTIIDNYFKQYSSIKGYMDRSIGFAKENGYVQTLLGRKRWLKDIYSANATVRGFAERNAINMPIQGSAADMIKLAMVKIHHALKANHLKTKMVLQVHDELVFDVPLNEVDIVTSLVRENMEAALPLPNETPVKAETGVGKNWLEAH
jgi:DNA polymerase I